MHKLASKTELTADDLRTIPDETSYELVDGNLVERNMGALSSWVAGRLFRHIDVFADAHDLGLVWVADNGFQCFPGSPNKVRRPDVSFVRRGRLPGDRPPDGYVRIAPDLVVEVISPNDEADEVEQKMSDYLRAGVPLIWVVSPAARTVRVHRADRSGTWLFEEDEISGEDVLPGFRCRVGAIFPPRPAPEQG